MIKLTGKVRHDGKDYNPGDSIEKIKENEAQRLVNLGVAFFVEEKQNGIPHKEENPEETNNDEASLKEELDTIDYNDLKVVAKEVGLDFKGNISKKDLLTLIIKENKAKEILGLTEVEE